MKKTSKKFDKIRAICEEIQAQNEKRNPEHKEPFIFLAKIYKDESEVLHGAIDAEEGDISRMLVLAMENDKLFAKEVIKATRDFQFKQMSKGLKAVSEAFNKLSTKYPSGGIISGTDHGSGKDTEVVIFQSAMQEKYSELIKLRKIRLDLMDKIEAEKKSIRDKNRDLFSQNQTLACLANQLSELEQKITLTELSK